MKFTIELEEFWFDEDSSHLEDELKNHITKNVVNTVYDKIKNFVEDQITRQTKEMIEKTMYKKASLFMDKMFTESKIKSKVYENGRYVEKDVPIEDYIKNKFLNDSGWSSPNDKIEKLAKQFSDNFGKELKERYDLVFATHIVKSLDKQGMLKDGIANVLLQKNEQ